MTRSSQSREDGQTFAEGTASIVEFEIPASEFALREALATLSDVEFAAERVVAYNTERIAPFVWATSPTTDGEVVTAALQDDPSVETIDVLADLDDEWLYRMEWTQHVETLLRILVHEEGVIRSLTGHSERATWELTVLFPERAAVTRTHDFCEEAGLSLTTERLYNLDEGPQRRFGLTDDQHEALVQAVEGGYFDIPRGITAEELAEELDISHQAASERLRRAHDALITNTLMAANEDV